MFESKDSYKEYSILEFQLHLSLPSTKEPYSTIRSLNLGNRPNMYFDMSFTDQFSDFIIYCRGYL